MPPGMPNASALVNAMLGHHSASENNTVIHVLPPVDAAAKFYNIIVPSKLCIIHLSFFFLDLTISNPFLTLALAPECRFLSSCRQVRSFNAAISACAASASAAFRLFEEISEVSLTPDVTPAMARRWHQHEEMGRIWLNYKENH